MTTARELILENLLERVLKIAPRCFKVGCPEAAVYSMPTAALGDRICVCRRHRTSDGNEFDEKTVEVGWAQLHRKIRQALSEVDR